MPGTGSVHKVSVKGRIRWVALLSVGSRTNRRRIKRTRDTEREAKAALRELQADRESGTNPTRVTLADFLERWVREVRNIRPRTRVTYENDIRMHIVPLIGDVRLAALTPVHVESMLSALETRVAPKTALNVHAVLRRGLRDAVRSGRVSRNVAAREYVDAPRVPDPEPRALTPDEVRRLLKAVRGDWLEGLVVVALGTGMRQGELLGLAWEDLQLHERADFVNIGADNYSKVTLGVLHVRHALRRQKGPTRKTGRYLRDSLKTERSRRVIPLTPSVSAALAEQRNRIKAAGFVPTATGPVFPSMRGQPLSSGWVTRRFKALCAKAGIPVAPFKVLRSTFSSRLYAAGVPEWEVNRLMGHVREHVGRKHYLALGETPPLVIESIEELYA